MHRPAIWIALSLPAIASAQQNAPLRYLVTEARIESKALKWLWPTGIVAVGADGTFIVSPNNSQAGINGFDANGKATSFHIQPGWRNDADIAWPERIGRLGTGFWITDPFNKQVALFSRDAKLIGAIPHPTWVHPKWSERRQFPIFASMDVLAVYPDSQLLIRPTRPRTLLDTPAYDRKIAHLLRIKPDGQIQREIARFDEHANNLLLRGSNSEEHVMPVPYGARQLWSTNNDASRVAVVLPGVVAADSGTFRVISIDARGDTVFSRRYPMATVRVTPAQVDSVLKSVRAYGATPTDSVRARLRRKIPQYRSYVTEVVSGYDQSTWVLTRSTVDSSTTREALIIDPRGEPIARVTVPVGFTPLHADRDHVWGTDKVKHEIVRFKVSTTPEPTVAPPPRTAKAAAAKE